MPERDYRADWQQMPVDAIPSKQKIDALEAFLQAHPSTLEPTGIRLLDLGCGSGTLSARLAKQGYEVAGVDINEAAIRQARETYSAIPGLTFHQADIANDTFEVADSYHLVVCQLVISVIGDLTDRQQLLRNCQKALRPNGSLYLSASGISDTINDTYNRLYARDAPAIGEAFSYFSRDADGNILYQTHHFSARELIQLLYDAGFTNVHVETIKEQSSRRPDQAAYFHYAIAQKPPV